jgi:hypothetical protein
VLKRQQLDSFLSQLNLMKIFATHFSKINFNIILYSMHIYLHCIATVAARDTENSLYWWGIFTAGTCLPSRCLQTGCLTSLFYCCVRVLLSNVCFSSSTVLAWCKYATILGVSAKGTFLTSRHATCLIRRIYHSQMFSISRERLLFSHLFFPEYYFALFCLEYQKVSNT